MTSKSNILILMMFILAIIVPLQKIIVKATTDNDKTNVSLNMVTKLPTDLQFGEGFESKKKSFGIPYKIDTPNEDASEGICERFYFYKYFTVRVILAEFEVLDSVTVFSPKYVSKCGLKIGDDEGLILKKYGKPIQALKIKKCNSYFYKDIDEGYGKLQFVITASNNKIKSFEIKM